MSPSSRTARRGLPTAGVAVPADKRFRRSDLRQDRRRIGRTLFRIAKWTVSGLAVVAAAVWLMEALLHANVLAVQQLVVRGNTRLSVGEVEALIDGIRGENIFRVDFERYRHRAMDSPWIADLTLRRVLPATIEVQVVERTPLAIARLGQQLYLVDNTGVIIDEYGAAYADIDLPIVDGLVSSPASQEPLVDRERVRLTEALFTSFAARPDLRRRLSQVDVSNAHDAVVMFDNDPVWLHLGESRFIERLRMYLELTPTLKERFVEIDAVDLRFDERVFVHSRGRVGQADRLQ